MKTKTSFLTVIMAFFILLVICYFSFCDEKPGEKIDKNDLNSILIHCKGHVIVVAKGYNSGNFEPYRHYLILRDDSFNCYEYIGADYKVSVVDTIK